MNPFPVRFTKNLGQFHDNPMNRVSTLNPSLVKSMEKYGPMPEFHINVAKRSDKDGGYTILQGHHRVKAAQKVECGIWYAVIPAKNGRPNIAESEDSLRKWTPKDYVVAYKNAGLESYKILLEYHERTHAPISTVKYLFQGKVPSGGETRDGFRLGKFLITDYETPSIMEDIIARTREINPKLAKNGTYIKDVVRCITFVDGFDIDRFKRQLRLKKTRQYTTGVIPTKVDMLNMISRVYNEDRGIR